MVEVVRETLQFVGVGGEGECGVPLEVLCAEGNCIEHELQSGIAHLTHVGACGGVEVGRRGDGVVVEQSLDEAVVVVYRRIETVVEHAEVYSDAILMLLLPL